MNDGQFVKFVKFFPLKKPLTIRYLLHVSSVVCIMRIVA